ncbi:hypothetical protein GCM10007989_33730 [Devosia pacifica]|uniref:Uncharacterized protein n=1 Tax=Devosia pacifica TaxID=1335967 RepID=A0A918SD54_9HYPH|nr:hypothetical protein [Devosia pacifica]GHA35060.1 hypothetical protein GCM10007989_33730 [Devosia pacifica]
MATLVTPILFSKHFGVSPEALAAEGLFDPVLNADSRLFIDPLLLKNSDIELIRENGNELLRKHFGDVVRLLAASKTPGDAAWKGAGRLLNLKERPETCLGYGGSSTRGSSRPRNVRDQVLATAKEIITLGETDPEIISLMGMFEEGVGPDTISDLATNAIFPALIEVTEKFCKDYGVETGIFKDYGGRQLPPNPGAPEVPIILVPCDILRDLPLAADWSDVSRVVLEIERIREAFNGFVGPIAEATMADKKAALRKAALESVGNFRTIFEAILVSSDAYDPKSDPLNLFRFRELMASRLEAFKKPGFQAAPPSREELLRAVTEIVNHFRYMVEQNNLWELLWDKDKPKRERAAQLVFFAVAELFCKANNIDIAPETNTGGGPVDFRFSIGYANRIVVEMKLSKGQVVHGYKTQTRIYQQAARTDEAVFIVVNVGGMRNKLGVITKLHENEVAAGKKAPQIEIVDGRRRKSASTRENIDDVIDDDEGGEEEPEE